MNEDPEPVAVILDAALAGRAECLSHECNVLWERANFYCGPRTFHCSHSLKETNFPKKSS